jgi:hypothetical protein
MLDFQSFLPIMLGLLEIKLYLCKKNLLSERVIIGFTYWIFMGSIKSVLKVGILILNIY